MTAADCLNTGGRYNPSTDSWTATSTTNAPDARYVHTAVWTGSEMIVWGGSMRMAVTRLNTGGRYNPSTDSWTATSTTNAPAARAFHTAVWTGSEMIVWGGYHGGSDFEHWREIQSQHRQLDSHQHHQCARCAMTHTAVWTGSEMIVWGGFDWRRFEHRREIQSQHRYLDSHQHH